MLTSEQRGFYRDNERNEARTTLLVQMRDPSDPPSNDEHRSRGQGMMLSGIDPLLMPAAAN